MHKNLIPECASAMACKTIEVSTCCWALAQPPPPFSLLASLPPFECRATITFERLCPVIPC